MMAKTLAIEAQGQSDQFMYYVAQVFINRYNDPRYPNDGHPNTMTHILDDKGQWEKGIITNPRRKNMRS